MTAAIVRALKDAAQADWSNRRDDIHQEPNATGYIQVGYERAIRVVERMKTADVAPEMLEALEGMCAAYRALCQMTGQDFPEHKASRYQAALAAIAKAKGEAQ